MHVQSHLASPHLPLLLHGSFSFSDRCMLDKYRYYCFYVWFMFITWQGALYDFKMGQME